MELKNASVNKVSENVINIVTPLKKFSIFWIADAHLDSGKSSLKFLYEVLDSDPDAFIIFGGDSHDLMQGRHDKRGSKSDLLSDFKKSDYWNAIVKETREKIIDKYQDRILCWTEGNHETSVLRNLELDFLDMLLDNGRLGLRLYTRGWIMLRYKDRHRVLTFPIFFQHAPTTGGTRSKGALSFDLLLADNPDAKLQILEHIHTGLIHPATVERINERGNLYNQVVWLVICPTIKDESEGKKRGYFHEKIKRNPPTVAITKFNFDVKNTHSGDRWLRLLTPEFIIK